MTSHDPYALITDPGLKAYMIEGAAFYPDDAVNFTMDEQRAFYDRYCAHFRRERPAGITAEDVTLGGVPCRHYRRKGAEGAPVLVYFHGGGFVLGGLDSLVGAVAMGVATGLIMSLVTGYSDASNAPVVSLVLLAGTLLIRPGGMFGHSTVRSV